MQMLQKLVKRGKLEVPVRPVIPEKFLSFDLGLTFTPSNPSSPFQEIVSWKQFDK